MREEIQREYRHAKTVSQFGCTCLYLMAALLGALAALTAGMTTFMVPEWATPTPELTDRCAGMLGSLSELPARVLGR